MRQILALESWDLFGISLRRYSHNHFYLHNAIASSSVSISVVYTYPDSRYSPVSDQSSDSTHPPWPVKFATCSPEFTSYRAIILASPPAASNFDAGENATLRTGFTRPASECERRPVSLLKM